MLRIAFLGFTNSFDFHHIGGMDSLMRRLALQLSDQGDEVFFVQYGTTRNDVVQAADRVYQASFMSLEDALSYIKKTQCNHVVSVYLRPRERFRYARFRQHHKNLMRFHHIYSAWNESRLKRELLFSEARFFPFNGTLFCVSPRIYSYVRTWATCSALLLPPVDESYFCRPREKSLNGKLRLTYAGRLDPNKGAAKALEVLRRFADRPDYESRIFGFAWSHKPETLHIHETLTCQKNIIYEPCSYQGWSPEVENTMQILLRQTDILLLPYLKLSSTVDTPLLLLEGMASLCAVITPPLGDLHTTYGKSRFNLYDGWNTATVVALIENASPLLEPERERLLQQNAALKFDMENITNKFKDALSDDPGR